MNDFDELLEQKAFNYVSKEHRAELTDYIFGITGSVSLPLRNSNYILGCETTSGTEFGESDIKIYDGSSEVARCIFVDESHYEWEVNYNRRGEGLGDISRTIAEARDGMLETEFAVGPSLANALYRRGYDPIGMDIYNFEAGLDDGFDERVPLVLNYERAYNRIQNQLDKLSE